MEAVLLLRAYRTTQPRIAVADPVAQPDLFTVRRISAAFKDIPGGQILGPTLDYSHRLLQVGVLMGEDYSPEPVVPATEPAPATQPSLAAWQQAANVPRDSLLILCCGADPGKIDPDASLVGILVAQRRIGQALLGSVFEFGRASIFFLRRGFIGLRCGYMDIAGVRLGEDRPAFESAASPGNNRVLERLVGRCSIPFRDDPIDLAEERRSQADVGARIDQIWFQLRHVLNAKSCRILRDANADNSLSDIAAYQGHSLLGRGRRRREDHAIARCDGDPERIVRSHCRDELLDNRGSQARVSALLDEGGIDHKWLPQMLNAMTRGKPNSRAHACELAFWMATMLVFSVHQPLPVATMRSGE